MTMFRLNIGWDPPEEGTFTVMALLALFSAWLSLLAPALLWLSLFEWTVGLMVLTISFLSVLLLLALALLEPLLPPPVPVEIPPAPGGDDDGEGCCVGWVV